ESMLLGAHIGKLNVGEESFIRTHYDKETLINLKKEIGGKSLQARDRLGLARDFFALAEAGYIKTSEALEFSLAFKHETEYIVWSEIASGIARIKNLISNEKFKELFSKYINSLFSPLVNKLTFEKIKDEEHSQVFLRSLAISIAGINGDKKTTEKA